jgi:hypothetical protein
MDTNSAQVGLGLSYTWLKQKLALAHFHSRVAYLRSRCVTRLGEPQAPRKPATREAFQHLKVPCVVMNRAFKALLTAFCNTVRHLSTITFRPSSSFFIMAVSPFKKLRCSAFLRTNLDAVHLSILFERHWNHLGPSTIWPWPTIPYNSQRQCFCSS